MLKIAKVGQNYRLNYSGVIVTGKLLQKTERMTLLFRVICPFEDTEKTIQFIHSDILGESSETHISDALLSLEVRLIYAKDFTPHKVGYYEERIKQLKNLQTA